MNIHEYPSAFPARIRRIIKTETLSGVRLQEKGLSR
jgi:hypothetical protein